MKKFLTLERYNSLIKNNLTNAVKALSFAAEEINFCSKMYKKNMSQNALINSTNESVENYVNLSEIHFLNARYYKRLQLNYKHYCKRFTNKRYLKVK